MTTEGVVRLTARESTLVDLDKVADLRCRMGDAATAEILERAICRLSRDMSALSEALAAQEWRRAAPLADALGVQARALGLCRMDGVSLDLRQTLARGDHTAAHAIAARLTRLGEESMFCLVSMSDGA